MVAENLIKLISTKQKSKNIDTKAQIEQPTSKNLFGNILKELGIKLNEKSAKIANEPDKKGTKQHTPNISTKANQSKKPEHKTETSSRFVIHQQEPKDQKLGADQLIARSVLSASRTKQEIATKIISDKFQLISKNDNSPKNVANLINLANKNGLNLTELRIDRLDEKTGKFVNTHSLQKEAPLESKVAVIDQTRKALQKDKLASPKPTTLKELLATKKPDTKTPKQGTKQLQNSTPNIVIEKSVQKPTQDRATNMTANIEPKLAEKATPKVVAKNEHISKNSPKIEPKTAPKIEPKEIQTKPDQHSKSTQTKPAVQVQVVQKQAQKEPIKSPKAPQIADLLKVVKKDPKANSKDASSKFEKLPDQKLQTKDEIKTDNKTVTPQPAQTAPKQTPQQAHQQTNKQAEKVANQKLVVNEKKEPSKTEEKIAQSDHKPEPKPEIKESKAPNQKIADHKSGIENEKIVEKNEPKPEPKVATKQEIKANQKIVIPAPSANEKIVEKSVEKTKEPNILAALLNSKPKELTKKESADQRHIEKTPFESKREPESLDRILPTKAPEANDMSEKDQLIRRMFNIPFPTQSNDQQIESEGEQTTSSEIKQEESFQARESAKVEHKIKEARAMVRSFAHTLKEQVENYKPPIMRVALTLNPANLGRVEVILKNRGDTLNIQVTSNPQAVMNLYQQNAEFRQSLYQLGYTNVNLDFSDGKERRQHRDSQQDSGDDERNGTEDAFEPTVMEISLPIYG